MCKDVTSITEVWVIMRVNKLSTLILAYSSYFVGDDGQMIPRSHMPKLNRPIISNDLIIQCLIV